MSTYIIGDIHGCFDSLKALLKQIDLKETDRIWCVGDLINRGPCSLEVLQWVMKHETQVQIILGNHELHFLACVYGAKTATGDTLDTLLNLEKETLKNIVQWLRKQPILHEEIIHQKCVAMVHAGVNAQWSWSEVKQRARNIEAALATDEGLRALAIAHPSRKKDKILQTSYDSENTNPKAIQMVKDNKAQWIDDLKWFTRVRTLDQQQKPVGWFKGNPDELPHHLTPWFKSYEKTHQATHPDILFYGHWAAFGIQQGSCYFGLDSACIWGQTLSAVRVEDGKLFQIKHCEQALTPKHLRRL